MAKPGVAARELVRWERGVSTPSPDLVAVEEPLEIRLVFGPETNREERAVAVTMRTPGHDFELALGFLYGEGLLRQPGDVRAIRYCDDAGRAEERENIVKVLLAPDLQPDLDRLARNFYTTSSCGVCGKSSIEAVQTPSCPVLPAGTPRVDPARITQLPTRLRESQWVFEHTGGLHAAAWFDLNGELQLVREDVGRHNALDKLIGASWSTGSLPLNSGVLLLSGRASFELIQKAYLAGIPVLAAVGAPSSLAVQLAEEAGMTLLGFVRDGRFNCYTGAERLA